MNIKKITAILSAMLLAAVLASCGGDTDGGEKAENPTNLFD